MGADFEVTKDLFERGDKTFEDAVAKVYFYPSPFKNNYLNNRQFHNLLNQLKMKRTLTLLSTFILVINFSFAQKSEVRTFHSPVMTDSSSTLFFPIRYSEAVFSSHKIAFWGDYYANVLIYDFQKDTYKKLFENDTYIQGWAYERQNYYNRDRNDKPLNLTSSWFFFLVKNKDLNKSGRIDEHDPSILYVTDKKGQNLRALTNETENVVGFEVFEAQGFALIRIQRDANADNSYKVEDRDFYYKKINLSDLSFGKNIEIKNL
jgi:hypothetical protein